LFLSSNILEICTCLEDDVTDAVKRKPVGRVGGRKGHSLRMLRSLSRWIVGIEGEVLMIFGLKLLI
jgi:hypothetical protein